MTATQTTQTLTTSELLKACGLKEVTFWKWRQEGLIPPPTSAGRGRGRGMGRYEHQWSIATLGQIERLQQLQRPGVRYDELAVDLWLSGLEVEDSRVVKALVNEYVRFLEPFQALLEKIEGGPLDDEGWRTDTIGRFAQKLARRAHPRYKHLSPTESTQVEAVYRSIVRLLLPGTSGHWEVHDDHQLVPALGLSEALMGFFDDAEEGADLRHGLRGALDIEKGVQVLGGARNGTLRQARHFFRGLETLADLIKVAPEGLAQVSADWLALLQLLVKTLSALPRAIWVALIILMTSKVPASAEVLEAFASLEEVQRQARATRLELIRRLLRALRLGSVERRLGSEEPIQA